MRIHRQFGEKRFVRSGGDRDKEKAQKLANYFRSQGYNVRVTKSLTVLGEDYWDLWRYQVEASPTGEPLSSPQQAEGYPAEGQ